MSRKASAGTVVVDRYELVEVVGRGTIGVVWRAHDRQNDRQVALRELALPDVLDDTEQEVLIEKVLREARAASQLDHPAVVAVYDVVADGERLFVVGELVVAPTLAELVAERGPLPPAAAAAVGLELLGALTAAHKLHLVHRYVRPSSVYLPPSGGPRLADFGVASMVDDPKVAASGDVHDPSYLAPEQTEPAGASFLSDLWSLAATLYFAVEGVPPFDEGEPAATMAAIAARPPRPAVRAGSLAPALDALLVKDAMARPDDAATRVLLTAAASSTAPPPLLPDPEIPLAPTAAAPEPEVLVAPPSPPVSPVGATPAEATAGAETRAAMAAEETPAAAAGAGPPGPVGPLEPPPGEPPPVETFMAATAGPTATSVDQHDPGSPPGPATTWSAPAEAVPEPDAGDHPGRRALNLVDEPSPNGHREPVHVPTPVPAAAGAGAGGPGGHGEPGRTTEPWFFHLPVEVVPPPPLPEPPPPPPRAEPPKPTRFPKGARLAMLAVLVGAVMVALITTGGRQLRSNRPSLETPSSIGAPSSWVPYTDTATGFTLRYPPTWGVRRTGNQTVFVDPSTKDYFAVTFQQPPPPSPVAAWFDQEQGFTASHPVYNRLQIVPTTYQGLPAAIWEYTYEDTGTDVHTYNLDFTAGRYGFAIAFQTRSTEWARSQALLETFKAVFRAPT